MEVHFHLEGCAQLLLKWVSVVEEYSKWKEPLRHAPATGLPEQGKQLKKAIPATYERLEEGRTQKLDKLYTSSHRAAFWAPSYSYVDAEKAKEYKFNVIRTSTGEVLRQKRQRGGRVVLPTAICDSIPKLLTSGEQQQDKGVALNTPQHREVEIEEFGIPSASLASAQQWLDSEKHPLLGPLIEHLTAGGSQRTEFGNLSAFVTQRVEYLEFARDLYVAREDPLSPEDRQLYDDLHCKEFRILTHLARFRSAQLEAAEALLVQQATGLAAETTPDFVILIPEDSGQAKRGKQTMYTDDDLLFSKVGRTGQNMNHTQQQPSTSAPTKSKANQSRDREKPKKEAGEKKNRRMKELPTSTGGVRPKGPPMATTVDELILEFGELNSSRTQVVYRDGLNRLAAAIRNKYPDASFSFCPTLSSSVSSCISTQEKKGRIDRVAGAFHLKALYNGVTIDSCVANGTFDEVRRKHCEKAFYIPVENPAAEHLTNKREKGKEESGKKNPKRPKLEGKGSSPTTLEEPSTPTTGDVDENPPPPAPPAPPPAPPAPAPTTLQQTDGEDTEEDSGGEKEVTHMVDDDKCSNPLPLTHTTTTPSITTTATLPTPTGLDSTPINQTEVNSNSESHPAESQLALDVDVDPQQSHNVQSQSPEPVDINAAETTHEADPITTTPVDTTGTRSRSNSSGAGEGRSNSGGGREGGYSTRKTQQQWGWLCAKPAAQPTLIPNKTYSKRDRSASNRFTLQVDEEMEAAILETESPAESPVSSRQENNSSPSSPPTTANSGETKPKRSRHTSSGHQPQHQQPHQHGPQQHSKGNTNNNTKTVKVADATLQQQKRQQQRQQLSAVGPTKATRHRHKEPADSKAIMKLSLVPDKQTQHYERIQRAHEKKLDKWIAQVLSAKVILHHRFPAQQNQSTDEKPKLHTQGEKDSEKHLVGGGEPKIIHERLGEDNEDEELDASYDNLVIQAQVAAQLHVSEAVQEVSSDSEEDDDWGDRNKRGKRRKRKQKPD